MLTTNIAFMIHGIKCTIRFFALYRNQHNAL